MKLRFLSSVLLPWAPLVAGSSFGDESSEDGPFALRHSSSSLTNTGHRALLDFDNFCGEAPENSTQLIDCTCGFDLFPPGLDAGCETDFKVCIPPELVCGRPGIFVGFDLFRIIRLALPLKLEICYKDFEIGGVDIPLPLCLAPFDILSGATFIDILLDFLGLGILGGFFSVGEESPPAAVADAEPGSCERLTAELGENHCASAFRCTVPGTDEPCVILDCTNVEVEESNRVKVSTCQPLGFFPESRSDVSRVDELKMIKFDDVE